MNHMNTILLTTHIMTMIASMALMLGAVIWALRGHTVAVRMATVGMMATAVGTVSGAILLFYAPLLIQCVELTVYLAGTIALYTFGFGSGFADNARLVRRPQTVDAYDDMV